jgi:hypothetical protein
MPATTDQKLAIYEELVAATPDLERKGKTMPYTSINGNMFSFLGKDGALAFRLSKDERAAFLEDHPDAVVEQYGAVMKDYVAIPDAILEDRTALQSLWNRCVANAQTLKPKPTTKKK